MESKPGPSKKGPKLDADPQSGPSDSFRMDTEVELRSAGPHLPRIPMDSSPSSSFSMEPRIGPSSPWSSNIATPSLPPVYSPLFPLESFPTDSPYPLRIPLEETLMMRQEHIPSVCTLHMEKSPLKLVRGLGQYVYDEHGIEYLDCINNVAHVGHCNPHVVNAGKVAMATMGCISASPLTAHNYYQKLKSTFPHELDTFLFVSSGSEANDLAIRLARLNSNGYDVVAVEGSYHGNLLSTNEISLKQFSLDHLMPGFPRPESVRKLADWVHVIPCPDLYQGKYDECSSNGLDKYKLDARRVIDDAVLCGIKIACFICEPLMTHAGVILPPEGWLSSVYNDIHAAGGLVIADETGCGLGRTGMDWWSFQYSSVVPDIVTLVQKQFSPQAPMISCGLVHKPQMHLDCNFAETSLDYKSGIAPKCKPVGNGHPMALVATRASIAAKLGDGILKYQCCEVEAAIGVAVLNAIRSENLMKNAWGVGSFLREGLKSLAASHPHIGHVRGVGLIVGVEVVHTRESRKPATEIADQILYKFKEHRMILATDGLHKNVLVFSPPMCFDIANAHQVIVTLNKIMVEIEMDEPVYSEQIYFNSNEEIRPGGNRFRLEDYDDDEATQKLLAMD